jgi:type III restriction enzyme
LYFVVETKGGLFTDALRPIEEGKINCGKAHFKALAIAEDPAEYVVEKTVSGLLSRL